MIYLFKMVIIITIIIIIPFDFTFFYHSKLLPGGRHPELDIIVSKVSFPLAMRISATTAVTTTYRKKKANVGYHAKHEFSLFVSYVFICLFVSIV